MTREFYLPLDRRKVLLFSMFHIPWSAEDHGGIVVETFLGVLRMHRERALKFEPWMSDRTKREANSFAGERQQATQVTTGNIRASPISITFEHSNRTENRFSIAATRPWRTQKFHGTQLNHPQWREIQFT